MKVRSALIGSALHGLSKEWQIRWQELNNRRDYGSDRRLWCQVLFVVRGKLLKRGRFLSLTHGFQKYDNQAHITHLEELKRELQVAPNTYTRSAPLGIGGSLEAGPGATGYP